MRWILDKLEYITRILTSGLLRKKSRCMTIRGSISKWIWYTWVSSASATTKTRSYTRIVFMYGVSGGQEKLEGGGEPALVELLLTLWRVSSKGNRIWSGDGDAVTVGYDEWASVRDGGGGVDQRNRWLGRVVVGRWRVCQFGFYTSIRYNALQKVL